MIVYIFKNGVASDLRYEPESYDPQPGERSIPGFGELPPLDSLHAPGIFTARQHAADIALKRSRALRALDEQRLSEAAADPNAPQDVKDYAAALQEAP